MVDCWIWLIGPSSWVDVQSPNTWGHDLLLKWSWLSLWVAWTMIFEKMDVGRNERWNKITQSGVDRKLGQGLPGIFCDMHVSVCYTDEIVTHAILWKRVHIIFLLQGSVLGKMKTENPRCFFTEVSSIFFNHSIWICLFTLFVFYFISIFETIQFRQISMVFFSISCSRSCFFYKTSCRRRCSLWGLDVGLVTASLGHPFGSLESWIFVVRK